MFHRSKGPTQGGFLTRLLAGIGNGAQLNGQASEEGQSTDTASNNVAYSGTATVNKNGSLFNDIFNVS